MIYLLSDLTTIIKLKQKNKRRGGVYGFLNIQSKKVYTGSSRNITKRFKEHYRDNKTNIHLYDSVRKHSWSPFCFIIFEYWSLVKNGIGAKSLSDLENIYLKLIKFLYLFYISLNAVPSSNYYASSEIKEKLSKKKQGEKSSNVW